MRRIALAFAVLLVGCDGLKEALTAQAGPRKRAPNVRPYAGYVGIHDDTTSGVRCYMVDRAISCVRIRP